MPAPAYTGWDADGGYAEYAAVPAAYAYRLPDGFGDAEAAPLLCAGIIGYRALRRAALPPGGRLGIYGFGGQRTSHRPGRARQGAEVHVLTRGADAPGRWRSSSGAASAGDAYDAPPGRWTPRSCSRRSATWSRSALEALDRGGRSRSRAST